MRVSVIFCVSATSAILAGCVLDDVAAQFDTSLAGAQRSTAAAYVGPNPIPWQLTPASAASRAQGEVTSLVDVPFIGRVRGTEKAVADWNHALVPFTKDDTVVAACKKTFEPQAISAGAYYVEAAAAGSRTKVAQGWRQQVFFRILYHDTSENGVEVRQASIACVTDESGFLKKVSVV